MASPIVRRFSDPRSFLGRVGPWLMEREAEHTLPLGIAADLAEGKRYRGGEPAYLADVQGEEGLVGCALRTPPWPLVVTELPSEAVASLVRDVADMYPDLPGVIGPHETSGAFARQWAAERDAEARPRMRERLFGLERLVRPERSAPGHVRRAGSADPSLVSDWLEAFSREASIRLPDPEAAALHLVERGAVVLWEDRGAPRSMAAIGARSPHVARVGYVYTPPDERGRGYATACVATLSRELLDGGCERVVLFTDLANPTSNAIYVRLGYRPIQDVTEWTLAPGTRPGRR